MVEFIVEYTMANANDRDAFYRELAENNIRALCEAEDGCLRYEYVFPTESENVLLLIEFWESLEHQKVHLTQPHIATVGKLKEKYKAKARFEMWDCTKH